MHLIQFPDRKQTPACVGQEDLSKSIAASGRLLSFLPC